MFQHLICKKVYSTSILLELLQWGRLSEPTTNFILDKAKFAVKCGRFGENFNAV